MGIKDIFEIFGLKSTAHLCRNSHIGFPLNQQIQSTKSYVSITASKQVCGELVKLNAVEFKGKCLLIEDAKVSPKITNSNTRTSPDWFEPLRYMNNSPALGNNIDNREERDLHVYFKRTVGNSLQNFKYIFKQKRQVVVNTRPENQTTYSKVSIFLGD